MKKYLFGWAMLIGAGLMFVLMHGEIRAEGKASKREEFKCVGNYVVAKNINTASGNIIYHCETKTMDCALFKSQVSCFKK